MKKTCPILILAAALLPASGCGNSLPPKTVQEAPAPLILHIDAGAGKSFTIPTNNVWAYDWYIDWGDGTPEAHETGTGAIDAGISHGFPGDDVYVISIRAEGDTGHAAFGFLGGSDGSNAGENKQKLLKALGHINENTGADEFPSAWAYCFSGCTNLNEVSASLLPAIPNGTSGIFSYMFENCSSLESLPEGFSLPEVPNGTSGIFSYMFSGCNLKSLPEGFSLPAVPKGTSEIFSYMFHNCSSLESLPEGFSLPEVPNGTNEIFSYMFHNCSSLESLPGGFTLPEVPNGTSYIFPGMFSGCYSLKSLPGGFTLPEVPKGTSYIFSWMFSGCYSLERLPDGFSLPAVPKGTKEIFSYMFSDCSSLERLPEGFSLPAAPNGIDSTFSGIFYECSKLEAGINELIRGPLMSANQLNLDPTAMYGTFYNCVNLSGSALDAINTGFEGATPSTGRQTFYDCTGLSDYASIPDNWK
jgi:hypothetical protein